MGYTNGMIIIFAITAIVWPIFFYVVTALRTAKSDINEAATIFGAHGWKRGIHFYLPLSFPAIVSGSIVAISIGWEAILGVELIGKISGIGTFIDVASTTRDHLSVWAGVLAILILVYVLNKVIWTPLIKRAEEYAE